MYGLARHIILYAYGGAEFQPYCTDDMMQRRVIILPKGGRVEIRQGVVIIDILYIACVTALAAEIPHVILSCIDIRHENIGIAQNKACSCQGKAGDTVVELFIVIEQNDIHNKHDAKSCKADKSRFILGMYEIIHCRKGQKGLACKGQN